MLALRYGETQTLRHELSLPSTSVTVTISNVESGTATVSAAAATIYTATTLAAAGLVGDTTITLHSGAGAVTTGDRLCLTSGGSESTREIVEVESYASGTKIATLKTALQKAHSSGAAVAGLWATYSLNASTTTTYTAGSEWLVTWHDVTNTKTISRVYDVRKFEDDDSDLQQQFAAIYPALWESSTAQSKWSRVYSSALADLSLRLLAAGNRIERIRDRTILDLPLLHACAVTVMLGNGDSWSVEYERAKMHYDLAVQNLGHAAVWIDDDQSGTTDVDEVRTPAQPVFRRNF